MRCMNILACTNHISWYTYKKIMKPIVTKTRTTKVQPRASLTHTTSTNNKKHKQNKKRKQEEAHTTKEEGNQQIRVASKARNGWLRLLKLLEEARTRREWFGGEGMKWKWWGKCWGRGGEKV